MNKKIFAFVAIFAAAMFVVLSLSCTSAEAKTKFGINKSSVIKYASEKHGFSLELPSTWMGKYTVKESSDANAKEDYVNFYHRATNLKNSAGHLFSIVVTSEQKSDAVLLGSKDGKNYYFTTPTEPQTEKVPQSMVNSYGTMKDELDQVKGSFKI